MFYSNYDENFIFNKAMSLLSIIKLGDKYTSTVEGLGMPPFDINKKHFESLNAEIYFSEFHHFESLFGLMLAIFQGLPHWLYLTTYKTNEIKGKVTAFLNGDILKVTNGQFSNSTDFINRAIYTDCTSSDEEEQKNWQANIDNILWALHRMGRKYLDAKEYNGYKHGLRVMTGPTSLTIFLGEEPDKASSIASDQSLIFLGTQDKGESGLTVYQTIKHFNIIESINHLLIMNMMTSTIKSTRLAVIKGEPQGHMSTFLSLNRDGLIAASKVTRWSFTA
jgi:hypothetical protein